MAACSTLRALGERKILPNWYIFACHNSPSMRFPSTMQQTTTTFAWTHHNYSSVAIFRCARGSHLSKCHWRLHLEQWWRNFVTKPRYAMDLIKLLIYFYLKSFIHTSPNLYSVLKQHWVWALPNQYWRLLFFPKQSTSAVRFLPFDLVFLPENASHQINNSETLTLMDVRGWNMSYEY